MPSKNFPLIKNIHNSRYKEYCHTPPQQSMYVKGKKTQEATNPAMHANGMSQVEISNPLHIQCHIITKKNLSII